MTANVGDIIRKLSIRPVTQVSLRAIDTDGFLRPVFQFFPQNHSVARAEYQHPCIPYENTGANKVGFWSGFQPTKQGDTVCGGHVVK